MSNQHPYYSKRDAKKATTELLLPNTKNQLAVHLQQNNVEIKCTDVATEIEVREKMLALLVTSCINLDKVYTDLCIQKVNINDYPRMVKTSKFIKCNIT